MAATSWPDRGILGSLKGFVEAEVANHLSTNQTIRQHRNPFLARILDIVLRPSILWLALLMNLLAVMVPLGSTQAYDAFPLWMRRSPAATMELREHLRNTSAYFLALQVALIALIFPIAIALVSLLVQRAHASSSNAHIQIYYDEARAWSIGASGIALAGVLSFQLLTALPIETLTMDLGAERLAREIGLTFLNFVWLICNLVGIWHFLSVSLQFVDPAGRERVRERFTVRRSMPQHLKIDLFVAAYLDSARLLLPKYKEEEEGPTIMFGHAAKMVGDIEVMKRIRPNRVLVDVWGRPLRVVLRRWWRDSQNEFSERALLGCRGPRGLGFPQCLVLW
jgi:hypothetical protein